MFVVKGQRAHGHAARAAANYPNFDLLDVVGPFDMFSLVDSTIINRQVQIDAALPGCIHL
jgi:hypothetical protein